MPLTLWPASALAGVSVFQGMEIAVRSRGKVLPCVDNTRMDFV